jgi:hypothetical protein
VWHLNNVILITKSEQLWRIHIGSRESKEVRNIKWILYTTPWLMNIKNIFPATHCGKDTMFVFSTNLGEMSSFETSETQHRAQSSGACWLHNDTILWISFILIFSGWLQDTQDFMKDERNNILNVHSWPINPVCFILWDRKSHTGWVNEYGEIWK